MTDTIVFDIGNVLLPFDWETYLDSFGYETPVYKRIADAMFLSPAWEQGDAGVPPDEWLKMFIANAPECEAEIRAVYERMGECIGSYPYTRDLIMHYKNKGYKTYYLSNYSEAMYNKSKDQLSFIELMDGGIFSYKVKCIKPGREIYEKLIEKYQITPDNAAFFDDRQDNVEAAVKLGFKGVVFTEEVALKELQTEEKGL